MNALDSNMMEIQEFNFGQQEKSFQQSLTSVILVKSSEKELVEPSQHLCFLQPISTYCKKTLYNLLLLANNIANFTADPFYKRLCSAVCSLQPLRQGHKGGEVMRSSSSSTSDKVL